MANNLIVSYDLMAPGQPYDRVTEAVKALGAWGKLEFSLFYVNSTLTAQQAAEHVWKSMTANDKLIVVDASNSQFYGYNIDATVLKHMQAQWYR